MNKEELLYNQLYKKTKDFGRTEFIKELMRLERENKQLKENNLAMQEEMTRTWEKLDQRDKAIKKANNLIIDYLCSEEYCGLNAPSIADLFMNVQQCFKNKKDNKGEKMKELVKVNIIKQEKNVVESDLIELVFDDDSKIYVNVSDVISLYKINREESNWNELKKYVNEELSKTYLDLKYANGFLKVNNKMQELESKDEN